jgi:Icc-related predicted phosphoesterase
MGDLHFGPNSLKTFSALFKSVNDDADIVVLCGDLTMRGLIEEARGLSEAISGANIPVIAVLGNHDHEANNQEEIMDILEGAGVRILERDPFISNDGHFGFVGTKGFCGGFTGCRIAPFGERILKMFINETFKEANKINRALKSLKADFKVVAYHYAPIRETCIGEHCELIPFLGSSILSDPPDTFNASLVLHGHAHHGREKGSTLRGVPVRNVALPIHNRKYVVYNTSSFSDHSSV